MALRRPTARGAACERPVVDPVLIARGLGIRVYTVDLAPVIVTVNFRADDGVPELYVNRAGDRDRCRFAVAHALAHHLDRWDDPKYGFIDRAHHLDDDDPVEHAASRFARDLLAGCRITSLGRDSA